MFRFFLTCSLLHLLVVHTHAISDVISKILLPGTGKLPQAILDQYEKLGASSTWVNEIYSASDDCTAADIPGAQGYNCTGIEIVSLNPDPSSTQVTIMVFEHEEENGVHKFKHLTSEDVMLDESNDIPGTASAYLGYLQLRELPDTGVVIAYTSTYFGLPTVPPQIDIVCWADRDEAALFESCIKVNPYQIDELPDYISIQRTGFGVNNMHFEWVVEFFDGTPKQRNEGQIFEEPDATTLAPGSTTAGSATATVGRVIFSAVVSIAVMLSA